MSNIIAVRKIVTLIGKQPKLCSDQDLITTEELKLLDKDRLSLKKHKHGLKLKYILEHFYKTAHKNQKCLKS